MVDVADVFDDLTPEENEQLNRLWEQFKSGEISAKDYVDLVPANYRKNQDNTWGKIIRTAIKSPRSI